MSKKVKQIVDTIEKLSCYGGRTINMNKIDDEKEYLELSKMLANAIAKRLFKNVDLKDFEKEIIMTILYKEILEKISSIPYYEIFKAVLEKTRFKK